MPLALPLVGRTPSSAPDPLIRLFASCKRLILRAKSGSRGTRGPKGTPPGGPPHAFCAISLLHRKISGIGQSCPRWGPLGTFQRVRPAGKPSPGGPRPGLAALQMAQFPGGMPGRRRVTSQRSPREPGVGAPPGTSPRPAIPADSLDPAIVGEPAERCRCGQISRFRVRSHFPAAFARYAYKPARSAPKRAGRALVRFGVLVSHGLPRRYDVRAPQHRATRQHVDGSRNGIRRYSEWTSKASRSFPTWNALPAQACKRGPNTIALAPGANLPLCHCLFRYVRPRCDGLGPQVRALRRLFYVCRAWFFS